MNLTRKHDHLIEDSWNFFQSRITVTMGVRKPLPQHFCFVVNFFTIPVQTKVLHPLTRLDMPKPSRESAEKGVKVVKDKIDMQSGEGMANTTGSKKLDGSKPSSGKQRHRGLGKAGAKRLGQMLRKAIQQKEGVKGHGNKPLPS